MSFKRYNEYNEATCSQCNMDAYIRIDDKDYCWNHLLHYAKNENKDMKKAWKTLYSIESDKFCNFVKNNLEINK